MYNVPTTAVTPNDVSGFQHLTESGAPVIIIGFDGSIKDVSHSALNLMDFRMAESIEKNFFQLIHKNQLYPVMRDVADIICRGKTSASWLIRIRTSNGTWKWFKAEVQKSNACEACICVLLRTV